MANASQFDTDNNGIGDVCEAATMVKSGFAVKSRSSSAKDKRRKPNPPAKNRSDRKEKSRRATASAKKRSNIKDKSRKTTAKNQRKRRR
jgi:hypothetical protein